MTVHDGQDLDELARFVDTVDDREPRPAELQAIAPSPHVLARIREASEQPTCGGDLGWQLTWTLPPLFPLCRLAIGDLLDPFRAADGEALRIV